LYPKNKKKETKQGKDIALMWTQKKENKQGKDIALWTQKKRKRTRKRYQILGIPGAGLRGDL